LLGLNAGDLGISRLNRRGNRQRAIAKVCKG
jgi:hypothetical protein